MSRTLVVWQPLYYPKLHYFARLAEADHFVIFDDAEFSRQSPQHRAPIQYGGKKWLTIPVKHTGETQQIFDAEIDMSQHWGRKHLNTLTAKYGGDASERFEHHYDSLDSEANLPDLTVPLLEHLLDIFDIEVELHLSSEVPVLYEKSSSTEYLVNLTEHLDCDRYYCGKRACEAYLDLDQFDAHDLTVETQDWEPRWTDGNVVCLDVVFGAETPRAHIS